MQELLAHFLAENGYWVIQLEYTSKYPVKSFNVYDCAGSSTTSGHLQEKNLKSSKYLDVKVVQNAC